MKLPPVSTKCGMDSLANKSTPGVHRHHAVEVLDRQIRDHTWHADSGSGHNDSRSTQLGRDPRKESGHGILVTDIHADTDRPRPVLGHPGRDASQTVAVSMSASATASPRRPSALARRHRFLTRPR